MGLDEKDRMDRQLLVSELILKVFRVNGELLQFGDRITKPLGITSARWQIMGALVGGERTVPQIARRMGLQRQGVHRIVKILKQEKLVETSNNPDHKTSELVTLSRKGQRVYDEVLKKYHDSMEAILPEMYPRTLQTTLNLLDELQGYVEQQQ